MCDIIVIGGGAAGMMAALTAAEEGAAVVLLEKNEKLGKKLYITGKGRCNLTNACNTVELFDHITRNPKFMYSAIYGFDNFRVMDFFEKHGVKLKTERGNRVFPVSDHSSDVIAALWRALRKHDVRIVLNAKVRQIVTDQGKKKIVQTEDGSRYEADAVILATGGYSYPSTGSTGDGFRMAEKAGHTILECHPSLVPFETREDYVRELMGLSLKNVAVTILNGRKQIFSEFGEMLFTHYGVSGPLILSASSKVNDAILQGALTMEIDLKPALTKEQLDKRLLRDFEVEKNKNFINAVSKLYPSKLIGVIVKLSGIAADKKVNSIEKEERERLIYYTKHFPLTLTGLRGFDEAIITRGGVSTREVNPSTMESRLVPGLYFAGEMLDADALTGGFNLQIAWSTGRLAGLSAANAALEEHYPKREEEV